MRVTPSILREGKNNMQLGFSFPEQRGIEINHKNAPSVLRAKTKMGGSSRMWERGHFGSFQRGDNRSAFSFVMETFCQPSNNDVRVAVAGRQG